MELENIKAAWLSLDERLKKQESIKGDIMKELILYKGNKSLGRLSNYDWFGLVVVILVFPIIPYFLYTQYHTFNIFSIILLCIFTGALLFSAGSQIWKLRTLGKIDYTEKISSNIKAINTYNLFIKKEKSFTIIIFALLVLFYISRTYFDDANINSSNIFLFFFLILVGGVIAQWQHKAIYKKNVESIQKSLDELKELEEE